MESIFKQRIEFGLFQVLTRVSLSLSRPLVKKTRTLATRLNNCVKSYRNYSFYSKLLRCFLFSKENQEKEMEKKKKAEEAATNHV